MKRSEEIKNPRPIILSSSTKPKNMQKAFSLATKRASRIRNSQMSKLMTQRQALEEETLGEVRNLWLSDSMPDSGKSKTSSLMRRIQMPTLIKGINHWKMGNQPPIPQPGLVTSHWSGRVPLPIFPPRAG